RAMYFFPTAGAHSDAKYRSSLKTRVWSTECSIIRKRHSRRVVSNPKGGTKGMRRSAKLFALLGVFSVLALAESWQGRLVDARCFEQSKSATTCDPTSSTTTFAL